MNHVWEIEMAAEEQVSVGDLLVLILPLSLLIQMPPPLNHTCVLPLSRATSWVLAWFQHAEFFQTTTFTQRHYHDLSANMKRSKPNKHTKQRPVDS